MYILVYGKQCNESLSVDVHNNIIYGTEKTDWKLVEVCHHDSESDSLYFIIYALLKL